MNQRRNYGDERQTFFCAHCGRWPGTADHVPSKVFLDEPYPPNLPVVGACQSCNEGLSLDEESVACLVEYESTGAGRVENIKREKIKHIFQRKPHLAARVRKDRNTLTDPILEEEGVRLRRVITKLARGHALFELNEAQLDEPTFVRIGFLGRIKDSDLAGFERPRSLSVFPEVGSRAMQRLVLFAGHSILEARWIVLQPQRYRYLAFVDEQVVVRMVMSEFPACEVRWSSS